MEGRTKKQVIHLKKKRLSFTDSLGALFEKDTSYYKETCLITFAVRGAPAAVPAANNV